jgi:hypothetical protein
VGDNVAYKRRRANGNKNRHKAVKVGSFIKEQAALLGNLRGNRQQAHRLRVPSDYIHRRLPNMSSLRSEGPVHFMRLYGTVVNFQFPRLVD